MADLNYSLTHRIVLLVDLSPTPHHTSYIESLLSSAQSLLSFPPLSLSLFSYKFFFSSLSPLLSSSALLKLGLLNANSLSFDRPAQTLASLSKALNSLTLPFDFDCGPAKADSVANSMIQLVHDYAWDSGESGVSNELVRSNLVVLFSTVCRSVAELRDYVGVEGLDFAKEGFFRGFGHVASAFSARDIHLCWVDVSYEVEVGGGGDRGVEFEESRRCLEVFKGGVKGLGWGFCSTGSIVLGSALVPFGLIYPEIGVRVLWNRSDLGECRKVGGQLNLEISDVKGRPLKCKCCDVQLVGLRKPECGDLMMNWKSLKLGDGGFGEGEMVWEVFGDGRVQIDIRSIHRRDEVARIEDCVSDVFLVRELSGESKRGVKSSISDFFADRVLEILMKDMGGCVRRKSLPIWEIFLSFLYRGDYLALVNITKSDGSSCLGLLKSFNISSSLLYLIKGDDVSQIWAHGSDGMNGRKLKEQVDSLEAEESASQSTLRDERKRKIRNHSQKYNDLSWSLFCKEALSRSSQMELEEAYFSLNGDASKKLKFLKCWMKQVSQSSYPRQCRAHQPKQHTDKKEMLGERVRVMHEESEQPIPSSFPQTEGQVPGDSHTQQGTHVILSESSETFFGSLSERIKHVLESGVDLAAFAHRIVTSSIHLLSKKLELPGREVLGLAEVSDSDGNNYGGIVASELMKLLLKAPKDLSGKHKDHELSSQGNGSVTASLSCEYKIREYELQILFRMEVLQSDIAAHINKSTKQKLVKQICSFLEFAQCNMEGGFFGDFNLNDYVETLIKSRYIETLEDVIHQIYERMDLLLFHDDEDESPNLLLNSEDSNHSLRERQSRENSASDHNDRGSGPPSSDDSSFPWGTQGFGNNTTRDHTKDPPAKEELRTHMADEARKRRERARRFSSFTRGVLDMQRVWAPKQSNLSKSKPDSLPKPSRKRRGRKESCDRVCETPESKKKPLDSNVGDEEIFADGNGSRGSPSSSVYKALFQDDD